jgi:5'-nucleotidase
VFSKKKTLSIDLDNVLVDFPSAFPILDLSILEKYQGNEDEIPGIIALMDPLPGAVDAYLELREIFKTNILSTASWENPSAWSDKLEWVKKHPGKPAYKGLILTQHKDLNQGDFLIDDRGKNGASEFHGEWIHYGSPKFPDWESVLLYLRKRTGRVNLGKIDKQVLVDYWVTASPDPPPGTNPLRDGKNRTSQPLEYPPGPAGAESFSKE